MNVCVLTVNVPPSHLFPVHDHKSQIRTNIVEKGGLWALCNRSGLTQKHMLLLLARDKPNTYRGCRNLALVVIFRIPLIDSMEIWISQIFFAGK